MILTILELKETYEEYATRPILHNPEDVYRFVHTHFKNDQESFILIPLNTKNGALALHTVTIGSVNANIVHPREVFRCLLNYGCAHFICCHNHPSGDPTPSKEDIDITKKLQEAGKIVGIDLLDHVIIGDMKHYSMKETGHIP